MQEVHHIKYEYLGPPFEEVGKGDESSSPVCLGQTWGALVHSAGWEWVGKPCTDSVRRKKGFGLKDCKWDIFANTKSTSL